MSAWAMASSEPEPPAPPPDFEPEHPEEKPAPVREPWIHKCQPRTRPESVPKRLSWAIGTASPLCGMCRGLGFRKQVPCACASRNIFDICLRRYRTCKMRTASGSSNARLVGTSYSRPIEEFQTDFLLCARRALLPATRELFELHFVRDMEYQQCCQRLGLDRGSFFHTVYQVKARVGWACRRHGLFPIDEYFSQPSRASFGGTSEARRAISATKSVSRARGTIAPWRLRRETDGE